MGLLEGRVALITGANGALGKEVTRAFLGEGAMVAGVSRSIKRDDFDHERFLALPAQIASAAAAQQVAAHVAAALGRIDALVHLVGGFTGGKPVAEAPDAELDQMLDVNLKSAFFMARAVLPHLRAAGGGAVIGIGSRAAVEPKANFAAYSASKAALVALFRAMATENRAAGITVNLVLPGTINTAENRAAMPKADHTKWVAPEHIARLLILLASGQLPHLSGTAIPMYGGEL